MEAVSARGTLTKVIRMRCICKNCLFVAMGLVVAAALSYGAVPSQISTLHPRAFVRNDSATVGTGLTVSQFRARASDPAYSAWSNLTGGGTDWEGILTIAAKYLMYQNASDLQTVRDWLVAQSSVSGGTVTRLRQPGNMALAFDWIYGGLSSADRSTIMSNIKKWTDGAVNFLNTGGPDINHNYTYMAIRSIAESGLILKGESGYDSVANGYLSVANTWLEGQGRALETFQAKGGTWTEGNHYNYLEVFRHIILACHAYRTASNRDYFDIVASGYGNFLNKTARFYVYNMRPDFTWERIGDIGQYKCLPHNEIQYAIEALALGLSDPTTRAMLRSFCDDLMYYCGSAATHRYYKWGMMLFYDKNIPSTPSYTQLPLATRMGAGTFEQVVFMGGWTEDDTMITFISGNHFTDHQHFDKGHFQIYHKGGLTCDAGTYDSMYSSHHSNYACRTVAHNSLLVYNPSESFPSGYVNDGGQRVIRGAQNHATWDAYLANLQTKHLDAADLEAYQFDAAGGRFSYARGELTGAYTNKVTDCSRQLLYLNQKDYLVVYDRVTSSDASFKKSWLLHSMQRPAVDTVSPPAGVTVYPNPSVVMVDRTGSQNIGAQTVTYSGRLFFAPLLPAVNDLTAVGGAGYEYYVDGTNYPPSGSAGAPREPGNWRVELSPHNAATADQFLVAFEITDTSTPQMVDVGIVADGGGKAVGVKFDDASEEQIVLFSADQNGAPISLPLSYTVTTSAPSYHVICELPPGVRIIADNGTSTKAAVAGAGGVAAFADEATGTHAVTISSGGFGGLEVKNGAGDTVAAIDGTGNLLLRGSLSEGTYPSPQTGQSEFVVRVAAAPVLLIASSGAAILAGACYEEEAPLVPPAGSFAVKDGAGDAVAYVDDSGDLHLAGNVLESVTW